MGMIGHAESMADVKYRARIEMLRTVFHASLLLGLLGCGPVPEPSSEGPTPAPSAPSLQAAPSDLGQCSTYMGAPISDAERAGLWNGRGDAQPLCLFIASVAWAEHDRQKASDLFALAMLRYQYDTVRCAAPISGPTGSAMTAGRMAAGDRLYDLGIPVGPEQIGAAAMDPKSYEYPIRHLQTLCDRQVKPADEWPDIQLKLQKAVAEAIEKSGSEAP